MPMPGRNKSLEKYRFGFKTQEQENEAYGKGNLNSALYWMYDTRIARRWNKDPKPNPSFSQYAVFENNSVLFSDKSGDTTDVYTLTGLLLGRVNDNLPNQAHFVDSKAKVTFDTYVISGENANTVGKMIRKHSIAFMGKNSAKSLKDISMRSAKIDIDPHHSGQEVIFIGQIDENKEIIFTDMVLPNTACFRGDAIKVPIKNILDYYDQNGGSRICLTALGHTHVSGYFRRLTNDGGYKSYFTKQELMNHYRDPSGSPGNTDYLDHGTNAIRIIGSPVGATIYSTEGYYDKEKSAYYYEWFK